MKKTKKSLCKMIVSLLSVIILCSVMPAVPTQAATSLRGESIYQIMVDRFFDGD